MNHMDDAQGVRATVYWLYYLRGWLVHNLERSSKCVSLRNDSAQMIARTKVLHESRLVTGLAYGSYIPSRQAGHHRDELTQRLNVWIKLCPIGNSVPCVSATMSANVKHSKSLDEPSKSTTRQVIKRILHVGTRSSSLRIPELVILSVIL